MEARLADLLAGLSRLADLGFGLQAGEALRSCALATRLARSLDLPEEDARAAFPALLHHVGCTGYAHETARVFGDELVLNLAAGRANPADSRDLFATFRHCCGAGRPGARVLVLDGHAHLAHLRDPAMVAAIVRRLAPP